MKFLAAILSLALIFSPAVSATPDVNKTRVWVDPQIEDFPYIHGLISSQLDAADNITVSIYKVGPAFVKSNTTHVIVFVSQYNDSYIDSISVYGGTDWPSHPIAVELLSGADSRDPVARILSFIGDTHTWQAAHPL